MNWLELLEKFGFPIAMCAVLMFWIYRREEREAKTQIARETRMAERIDKVSDESLELMKTVVSENTDAMRRMTHEIRSMREHCISAHSQGD